MQPTVLLETGGIRYIMKVAHFIWLGGHRLKMEALSLSTPLFYQSI